MGKLEMWQKAEDDTERGEDIAENGEQKIEAAEATEQVFSQIEAADDIDRAISDAIQESEAITGMAIAESEIETPGEEVSESLRETSEGAAELGDQELENADKASEATGACGEVGSGPAEQFRESGLEIQKIADEAARESAEEAAEYEWLCAEWKTISDLEGAFS